ncbi:MAG: carboxylesterase family protein, partial [Gammaproteobacteria bacterium]|nr:carboxylesterase family protein [Gammaproteobacteria bacterium]
AYHSGDLAYVFNTMDKTGCGWNKDDRELARIMNRDWINFAKRGDPNDNVQLHWADWSAARGIMAFETQPRLTTNVRNQKLESLAKGLGLSVG